MKKIEAIIKPYKFEEVRLGLSELGVEGMSVSEVRGYGRQRGHQELYRGSEYTMGFLPKVRLEIYCEDEKVDAIVKSICESARTGKIGDGKIFIYDACEAVRIRTGETDRSAI